MNFCCYSEFPEYIAKFYIIEPYIIYSNFNIAPAPRPPPAPPPGAPVTINPFTLSHLSASLLTAYSNNIKRSRLYFDIIPTA